MRTRKVLVAAVAAALGAVAARMRRQSLPDDDLWLPEPLEEHEAPVALPARREGSNRDRGAPGSVRMDVTKARESHLEPVVEFLTFLQHRRGDHSHLLFVRYDDLDALAHHEGEPVAEFLSKLDQLGVIVSQN